MKKQMKQLKEVRLDHKTAKPFRYWYYEFTFDPESGKWVCTNSNQIITLDTLYSFLNLDPIPTYVDTAYSMLYELGVYFRYIKQGGRISIKMVELDI